MGEGTWCQAKHTLAKHSFKYLICSQFDFPLSLSFPSTKWMMRVLKELIYIHVMCMQMSSASPVTQIRPSFKRVLQLQTGTGKLCFGEGTKGSEWDSTNHRLSVSVAQGQLVSVSDSRSRVARLHWCLCLSMESTWRRHSKVCFGLSGSLTQ